MIPLAAVSALPWRLIGVVAGLAAVAVLGWRVHAWHEAYKALPAVEKALKAEKECAENSECRAREQRMAEEVGREQVRIVTGYETELAAVRSRQPISVRVCDRGGVPVSGAAPGGHAGTPAPGIVPGSPAGDRDIGPELSALARSADEIVASCRALQAWNKALSHINPP